MGILTSDPDAVFLPAGPGVRLLDVGPIDSAAATNALLLETGDRLLLEDGNTLGLES